MPTKKDPTTWLNSGFFEKVLREATEDASVEVEDFFINLHANAAEHYASTIYKVHVSYLHQGKVEFVALVVKLIASKTDQNPDDSAFKNELNLYKNLVSPMQKMLKKAGVVDAELAPSLLYASTEPQPVIILEDAQSLDYETRKGLFNLNDSKVICTKLAKFHAASYKLLHDGKSDTLGNLSHGLFQAKPTKGTRFMKESFNIFTEELAKWEGFEVYAEKFKNLQSNFFNRGDQMYNQSNSSGRIKVLNHGDFHYNNMLMKLDENRSSLQDILLVDFTLSFCGSPAIDLFYLLYLVCERETRDGHRQELIALYHQQLVATLVQINHTGPVPTLADINEELVKCGFLEVAIVVCFVPFLYANFLAAQNTFDSCNDATQYRRQLYNNSKYREIIEPLLPIFLQHGALD